MSPTTKPNIFFRLVIPCSGLFVITVLAMLVASFDARSPAAQFFNRYGVILMIVEVVAVLGLGFLAMAVDRRETLNTMKSSDSPPQRPPTDSPEAAHDALESRNPARD
jgi:hypothetical protein